MSTQTWIGRISSSPELHRMPGSPVQNVTFTLEERPALAERGKRRDAAVRSSCGALPGEAWPS
ncbi:hypothetical protein [Kitasatospora sp. NPDC059571]|uniref:hypothetical protein n=1 Tax=Kitasatospora sp. NPDC059571 TaxID=3346871 RepID=UPI0036B60D4A